VAGDADRASGGRGAEVGREREVCQAVMCLGIIVVFLQGVWEEGECLQGVWEEGEWWNEGTEGKKANTTLSPPHRISLASHPPGARRRTEVKLRQEQCLYIPQRCTSLQFLVTDDLFSP